MIGGLSIVTFTKTFGTIFLGNQRHSLKQEPHEVSALMLIPQYAIIVVMIIVAAFPQFFMQVITKILSELSPGVVVPHLSDFGVYVSAVQHISQYSFLFVGLVFAFWGLRKYVSRKSSQVIRPTWGCGYLAPTSKIQYTGKSFTKTLSKTFNWIVVERKRYVEVKAGETFPKKRKYVSHYHDFFEYRLIHVVTNQLIYAANYFKFIQNGRVQSYVLYGIVFIMTIFVLTVFNLVS